MSFNLRTADFIEFDNPLQDLLHLINSGAKKIAVSGLNGSSKEFIISLISIKTGRPVLYLQNDTLKKENVSENISFFLNQKISTLRKKELSKKSLLSDSNLYETYNRLSFLKTVQEASIACIESSLLFEKLIPKRIFNNSSISLKVGNTIDRDDFIVSIENTGYIANDIVESTLHYTVRGSVIDIFPPCFINPLRIEFLGDEVHSLRQFNISSQTSINKLEEVVLPPASEFIFNPESIKHLIKEALKKASKEELTPTQKNNFLETFKKKVRLQETEWFTPYAYSKLDSLFDYIDNNCLIITEEDLDLNQYNEELLNSFHSKIADAEFKKFFPDFHKLYLTAEEVLKKLSKYQKLYIDDLRLDCSSKVSFKTSISKLDGTDKSRSPIQTLAKNLKNLQKDQYQIHLISYSSSENKKLTELIEQHDIKKIKFHVGNLQKGFISEDLKIAFFSENDIVEKKKQKSPNETSNLATAFINSFGELKPGDYLVHKQFGIGIFNGLKKLKLKNTEGDFIECEYRDGDKIFVPVQNLKIVQRYIGDGKKPNLDKLGSETWKKTVKKVKKAVENVAKELLQLYARRKTEKGYSFSKRDQTFSEFELRFPFEETKDQSKSIEEVLGDMESSKPMDRLICGDVGFGKTEVALRAAFKSSMDGKQVAFLVPTTLLAYQHFQTVEKRLRDYPINVEMLSRFRTRKEEKMILEKLKNGQIDILIATHKLLGKNIDFSNLGLVIIDEEHKFGVKHKEKLRALKSGVDVLSLSATPIPRTLQLSLANIRDISLINSPPKGRKPVDVFVKKTSDELIRKAILDEIKRKGSVFFINNRIEGIFELAERLKTLVPEASFAITHGKMRETLLEKTINDFINGKIDVLVTTAIVESGLDIPRANTIIINDSQKFGMADLYQLKGRVGRGETKGYAYFLIPGLKSLTSDARKRLMKISELQELGSGFKLALSDLELRGAGNLFGEQQSGHIANVGLEFYIEMLNSAISAIKNDDLLDEFEPEIKTIEKAFIPVEYMTDSSERLFYYKRISSAEKKKTLKALYDEITDRFGKIPQELKTLLTIMELNLMLKKAMIIKMEIEEEKSTAFFSKNSPLYQKFSPSGKLRIHHNKGSKYKTIKNRVNELIKINN